MEIVRFILIAVEILCSLLLIGVILLQQSKSQGMGVAFGGGMSETIFGSRAGNILTKATITLAIIFLANTTILGITYTSKRQSSLVDEAAVPAAPVPVQAPASSGLPQVPAPSQQGTLFTPDSEVPVAEAPAVVETVEVPEAPVAVEESAPEAATP